MGAIVLQFVEGSGLGAALIKYYDHGIYSHVDSVLPDGTLLGARDDVIDGIPSGVQIRPASYVAGEIVLRVTIPCTDAQQDAFYAFVRVQLRKPYDETSIAAFALGRDWRADDSWFCSELCAAAVEASGFVQPLSAAANKVAPDDLLLVISALVPISIPESTS
jgi:hypothetical protein